MTAGRYILILIAAVVIALIALLVSRTDPEPVPSPGSVPEPEPPAHVAERTQLEEPPVPLVERASHTTEPREPVVTLPQAARTMAIEHPETVRYLIEQHLAQFESGYGSARVESGHAVLRTCIATILTAQGRGTPLPGDAMPPRSPEMPPQDPNTTVDPGAFMTLHTRGRQYSFMRAEFPEYAELNDAWWRTVNSRLEILLPALTEAQVERIKARVAQALSLLPPAVPDKQ